MFYVCARSRDERGGVIAFDGETLEQIAFLPLRHASYLALSPDRTRLYAVCEDEHAGAVATFALDPAGVPHFEALFSHPGFSGCHLSVEPSGKFLYGANYSAGSFTEFRLENGLVVEALREIKHSGHGPDPERQEKAHVHFVQVTPDKQYLCVIDLGIDQVLCYPLGARGIDAENPKRFHAPPGAGPRHLTFNRAGNRAFLLNELDNTVMVLSYCDGEFTVLDCKSTLPEGFAGFSKAAAIRLSPDERFVLASNRGYDSIAVFGSGDELVLRGIVPVGGRSPRDFNFITGDQIAVANEETDNLVFFGFKDGVISPLGAERRMANPLCVGVPQTK